jgi:hypothetical protein
MTGGANRGAEVKRVHDADSRIARYFDRRAREKVAALRKRCSPASFVDEADRIRKALKATYLMPEAKWNGAARLIREAIIDGLAVEVRCLQVLPGVYSVLRIYRPPGGGRHPAVLYLPGHGDPAWEPAVQKRLLGFARQGYVAMTTDPFGQGDLTDAPLWDEYHGCGAMAHLLTAGQSLLGIIMASHTVELSYLRSRADVNPEQLVVMGGSMGGTHALWLSAIDERVKGAVAISAAPVLDPGWNLAMHCLCDTMAGGYNVADGEIVRALIAPRPLLVIYPDLEAPMNDEGAMLLSEGKLDFMDKAAKSPYFLTEEQMGRIYPFAREVYALRGAADRFKEVVVVGPHGDAREYRELAYGWFAHFLMGRDVADPIPEDALSPMGDIAAAREAISAWPDGQRPDDFLGPTEYTKRATAALLGGLPEPPTSREEARRLGAALKRRVRRLLGIDRLPRDVRFSKDGDTPEYVLEPEPGVVLRALVFRPAPGATPTGSVHVLLDPGGATAAASSADRERLTDGGAWVVCADLRGMGSTYATQAAYVGVRDQPLSVGAIKLGETVAGWWALDVLAVVEAARKIVGGRVRVIVKGKRETGLVAILAAGQSRSIDAVEADELPASYHCAAGYGRPYVYGDVGEHNADLGGYGSMAPCIPKVLKVADIPQLVALVSPRPLTIADPVWASGERLSREDLPGAFAWARRFYEVSGAVDFITFSTCRSFDLS